MNDAATKIQAQFRGHKTRRDLEKIKEKVRIKLESICKKKCILFQNNQIDQQETDYQKSPSDNDLTDEIKREQERAAISIQVRSFSIVNQNCELDFSGSISWISSSKKYSRKTAGTISPKILS